MGSNGEEEESSDQFSLAMDSDEPKVQQQSGTGLLHQCNTPLLVVRPGTTHAGVLRTVKKLTNITFWSLYLFWIPDTFLHRLKLFSPPRSANHRPMRLSDAPAEVHEARQTPMGDMNLLCWIMITHVVLLTLGGAVGDSVYCVCLACTR